MAIYQIPEQYYFRVHHVRPRFKDNIEEVLFYFSNALVSIGSLPKKDFIERFNQMIRAFPGNGLLKDKTINNWRTEISALFGFIEEAEDYYSPSLRAQELAKEQDLISAFKKFLFVFQYPGGHIKPKDIAEQINHRIRFKPAQTILKVLIESEEKEKQKTYLTKAEICHCIFNDLRCSSLHEKPLNTWKRIQDNRQKKIEYDETGDVIRYAGDIVDYMLIAGLLMTYDKKRS